MRLAALRTRRNPYPQYRQCMHILPRTALLPGLCACCPEKLRHPPDADSA